MDLSPSWEAANCAANSETSQHFVEPEGSLPRSQEPSTGPYPQPYRVHTTPPYLSKIHFNIVHHLRLTFASGVFPSGFPTSILYAFVSLPFMLHALSPFILLDSPITDVIFRPV
jgi:hypothetical protein